jgi:hypothetical protein
MLILAFGGGVRALRYFALTSVVVGCIEMFRSREYLTGSWSLTVTHPNRWFTAVIIAALALNFVIAIAPSTKLDELRYHMLVPKRVLEDDGLQLYRQPIESAIFPQMTYQLGLSAADAAGFPESGNVISWGIGAVLILFVIGVTTELTQSSTAGSIAGAVAVVGLYTAVWHVTSGAHALGDLATLTACLLVVLPRQRFDGLKPEVRLGFICLASCVAASTKISILPLGMALTGIGIYRIAVQVGWSRAIALALVVWGTVYGPAVVWTDVQSGSPFGLATAKLFHSHFFGANTLAQIGFANQIGLVSFLRGLPPWISVGMLAALAAIAVASIRREWQFRILLGLVVGQAVLIALLLPHDFRFLGGLQFAALVLGAQVLLTPPRGTFLMRHWCILLLTTCLPWLVLQAYYARPFVESALGMVSRDEFIRKYVPFTDDFHALDRILPPQAVLYVVNSRLPSYYAPRPVVYSLDDLRARGPLYRFSVGGTLPSDGRLLCTETLYENPRAIVFAFRTPGQPPIRDLLRVQRCSLSPVTEVRDYLSPAPQFRH